MANPETSIAEADDVLSGLALGIAATVATALPIVLVTLGYSLAFNSLLPRPEDVPLLMGIAAAAVVIAALTVFVLVLPIHWFLGRKRVRGVERVLLSGVIGALPASCLWLFIQMLSNDPLSRALLLFSPFSMFLPGLLGAIVYCLVSSRRKSPTR